MMAGQLCGTVYLIAEQMPRTCIMAEDGLTHIILEQQARREYIHLRGPVVTEVELIGTLEECEA